MVARDAALMTLVRAIAADDAATASRLLATSGSLASARGGGGRDPRGGSGSPESRGQQAEIARLLQRHGTR